MVRRKQQHPRALPGPPEARNADQIDVTRRLAPVPASLDSASAVHGTQISCVKASVVTSIVSDPADVVLLRHLAIDCKALSSITGARAGSQLSLSLTYEAPVIISWELHDRISDSFPSCSVSAVSTVFISLCFISYQLYQLYLAFLKPTLVTETGKSPGGLSCCCPRTYTPAAAEQSCHAANYSIRSQIRVWHILLRAQVMSGR